MSTANSEIRKSAYRVKRKDGELSVEAIKTALTKFTKGINTGFLKIDSDQFATQAIKELVQVDIKSFQIGVDANGKCHAAAGITTAKSHKPVYVFDKSNMGMQYRQELIRAVEISVVSGGAIERKEIDIFGGRYATITPEQSEAITNPVAKRFGMGDKSGSLVQDVNSLIAADRRNAMRGDR